MAKKRRSRQFKKSNKVISIDQARSTRLEKRRAQRAMEEEKQRQEERRNSRKGKALRRQQNRRRLIIALVIVALAALLAVSVGRIVMLKHEQVETQKQKAQLEQEIQEMQTELEQITNDENVEEQARSKLKLIKPGETVYIPDEDSDK